MIGHNSPTILQILARNKTQEEQKNILDAVEKLVSPEYMGERFLYLCVQRTDAKHTPAGFLTSDSIE